MKIRTALFAIPLAGLLLGLQSTAVAGEDPIPLGGTRAETGGIIPPTTAPPAPPPAPKTLEEVWAGLSPQVLLDEAVLHRQRGDHVGALGRLEVLLAREETARALYERGLVHELEERYAEAVNDFDAVTGGWPGTAEAAEAAFRRALCLGDMGQHAEALAQIKTLRRGGDWEPAVLLSLDLAQGVTEIGLERERRGVRRIQRALSALEGAPSHAWIRARARTALAAVQIGAADDLNLEGDRKAERNLVRRVALLNGAQLQILAIANLNEPEYVLTGLLMLGDGYVALLDDFRAAPPPSRLTTAQAEIYRERRDEEAELIAERAWKYYDEGVRVAANSEWTGALTEQLQARRAALQ